MTSIQIYLFRHGETDWNVERRFQGHTDIPLNEKGRRQALELAKTLGSLQLQVILSSDLSRALETARIAGHPHKIPVVATKELRESFLGEPEGKLRDDIIQLYGAEKWQRWLSVKAEDLDFCFPKGETKRAQLKRAQDFILNYLAKNPELRTAAVSTHGGTLRRLLHFCQGSPTEAISIPNCSIYHLEYLRADQSWHYRGQVSAGATNEKLFT